MADKRTGLLCQTSECVLSLVDVDLTFLGSTAGHVGGCLAGISSSILRFGRLLLGAAEEALCRLVGVGERVLSKLGALLDERLQEEMRRKGNELEL